MKFQIQRNALNEALAITSKAVNPSTIIPILSSFLFRIKDNECEICASGTDVFISKKIEVIAKGDVCIAIPANSLLNQVKNLQNQLLDFSLTETHVNVKHSSGKFSIPYESGEDFPVMNIEDEPVKLTMSGGDLLTGLSKTTFAIEIDPKRNLNTVNIGLSKSRIDFTATDANILSTIGFEVENETNLSLIVPVKTCTLIQGLNISGLVDVLCYKNNIVFNIGEDLVIQSVIVDAKYPDYKAVIPVKNDKLIVIHREQLISSIKRVVQFSNNITSQIRFEISENKICISSENELSENANEELTADYNGDQLIIGFNGKLLLSCLQKNSDENIFMGMSTHNKAMVMRNGDTPQNAQDLMLIMPCILSENLITQTV